MEAEKQPIGTEPGTRTNSVSKKRKNNNNATKPDPISEQAIMGLLAMDKEHLSPSDKALIDVIEEFAVQRGWVKETEIRDEKRQDTLAERRKRNYHNIRAFLEKYRALKKEYNMFASEFAERLENEDAYADCDYSTLFSFLSQRLDILSSAEEKRFMSTYAPQIIRAQKLEIAFRSLDYGLKVLELENTRGWELLTAYYISDETGGNIDNSELATRFDLSLGHLYKLKRKAIRQLESIIFGDMTNQEELTAILTYFNNQTSASNVWEE